MQINFLSANPLNTKQQPKVSTPIASSVSFASHDSFRVRSERKIVEKCYDEFAKKIVAGKKIDEEKLLDVIETDPDMQKQDELAEKYAKVPTAKNKIELLKNEEKMLWQELEKPELGIARNYFQLAGDGIEPVNMKPAIVMGGLNGIARTFQSYATFGVEKQHQDESKFEVLKKIVANTPDNALIAGDIKQYAVECMALVHKEKPHLADALKFVKANTELKDVTTTVDKLLFKLEYDEPKYIQKLKSPETKSADKRELIIVLGDKRSEKLKDMLPGIIQAKKTANGVRTAAIWAAGRVQSKESFNLLHQIVQNKETKAEDREMALHSFVMYVKHEKPLVKETLKSVIDEKSNLSELAQIMLDKVEGKYNTKNRELKNLGLTESQARTYKRARNIYIQSKNDLNIQQTNWVDRALAPFAKVIGKVVKGGSEANIINDTATYLFRDETGYRSFDSDLRYGGQYEDSIIGVNTKPEDGPSTVIINTSEFKDKKKFNVLAHEFNHNFLFDVVDEKDKKKLESLFKKALKGDKCLDDYAALNSAEYFAQGYEAYATVYKPHKVVINNADFHEGGSSHTRSTLKRKDPELYTFIEYCQEKYNVKTGGRGFNIPSE